MERNKNKLTSVTSAVRAARAFRKATDGLAAGVSPSLRARIEATRAYLYGEVDEKTPVHAAGATIVEAATRPMRTDADTQLSMLNYGPRNDAQRRIRELHDAAEIEALGPQPPRPHDLDTQVMAQLLQKIVEPPAK